jgi:hypothetical protein
MTVLTMSDCHATTIARLAIRDGSCYELGRECVIWNGGLGMTLVTPHDQSMISTMTQAIELTEDALGQVARVTVEGIRGGLAASSHVEAGERDMRSALRQLVLAERELRSRSELQSEVGTDLDERPGRIANVVLGPGSEAVGSGA